MGRLALQAQLGLLKVLLAVERLPASQTNPDLVAARFLLKPGRKYEQAVRAFEPYDRVREENPEARAAGKALIEEGKTAGPKRRTFVFVNNRLEGNAISTSEMQTF